MLVISLAMECLIGTIQFSSVAQLCPTLCNPWTAARQASLPITNFRSLPKLMFIELVMPFNHLILCCPPFLPPSIFPSVGVFSNESALRIRWPKYWSFSFSISLCNEYSGLISFRIDWFNLLRVQRTQKYSPPQFKSIGTVSLGDFCQYIVQVLETGLKIRQGIENLINSEDIESKMTVNQRKSYH